MNRTPIFRGKRLDNGQWVESETVVVTMEGDVYLPAQTGEESLFMAEMDEQGNILEMKGVFLAKIDPATRGEYVGINDRNGQRIFTGDICIWTGNNECKYLISWIQEEMGYYTRVYCDGRDFGLGSIDVDYSGEPEWIIIGNIHDNPELI